MSKKKKLIAFLVIISIIFITVGTTYALLSYSKIGTKNVSMTAGNIKLHYQEDSLKKINSIDALPMDDNSGKSQTEYFEFTITGQSATYDIPYVITSRVSTQSADRIPYKYIKVYLTEVSNNTEEQVLLTTYDKLAIISKNNHLEQKSYHHQYHLIHQIFLKYIA